MAEEGLQDNERLHQLSPELFLVLEASKTKAGGGGGGERDIYFGAVWEAGVSTV